MAADLTERHSLPRRRTVTSDGRRSFFVTTADSLHGFLPNPPPEGAPIQSSHSLPWRQRFAYFEWGFFTLNLGTGACTLLVGGISFDFGAREALGSVFLGVNIVFYILNLIGMALKAYLHPRAFRKSFTVPGQALFFPTSILAVNTILVGIIHYAVPYTGAGLVDALYVLFWIYVAASVGCAALLQWSMYDQVRDFEGIMPSECLPVFPLMLAGTLGASLAGVMDDTDSRALTLVLNSYVFQGGGFLISFMKLSTWISRNVLFGHPHDTRIIPIFFMAVGPPGFTALAFINLGARAAALFPAQSVFPSLPNAGEIIFGASLLLSLLLFGQCLWFILATSIIWLKSTTRAGRPVGWGLAWFATTFPLTGFFLAAGRLGVLMPSLFLRAFETAGCVLVFALWLFNASVLVLAIARGRLLVPPVAAPRLPKASDREDERRQDLENRL
ncbi:hypothetical protein EXIGLDRAFT_675822 [Exidia glandulosa HHB12029]|uniref:C4-dicarboxylate transporter/malic acid transport protein n=1 Tax=Exidia glandulosa HHB12029 TaxID=1314781 RepID=A0A165H9N8_EXIGL|nr:hypothetical protein EXIGLDRAFT_675822 [Exidia glandulosa HHB12029]